MPLAVVIASLLALCAIPVVSSRRIGAALDRASETVDPARALIGEVQLELALGRSALRDFLTGSAARDLQRYERAILLEQAAMRRLEPVVARMGAPVRARFAELRAITDAWHRRVETLLPLEGTAARAALVETDLYEITLLAAARFQSAIGRYDRELRARSRAAAEQLLWLTLPVVGMAGASVLAVAGLARAVVRHARAENLERERAQAALRGRSAMMRGITHDLKNPLGAIDGYAQLLQDRADPPLAPVQATYVQRIREAIASVLEIIERVLEVARAEGQLRIELQRVDPEQLAALVVERHRAAFERADVALALDAHGRVHSVTTDPERVGEILGNLLSNARKYTQAGGRARVCVEESSAGPRAGERRVAISVADDGPGIPPAQLDRLFEEFARGEVSQRGNGVGLAISRRIAELLGADLTVESEVGRGSTFTLWLPIRGASASEPPGS